MKKPIIPSMDIIGNKIIAVAKKDGLKNAFENIYTYMIDGTKSSRKPFHYCTLATIENNIPQQRTMVSQKVINDKNNVYKKIRFHADSRSPKMLHIDNEKINSKFASCIFYEPKHKIQIRMIGLINKAAVIDVQDTWENDMTDLSKRCYFNPLPPSSRISSFDDFKINHEKMIHNSGSNANLSSSFDIIEFNIHSIEFLVLGIHGHIRARQYIIDNDDENVDHHDVHHINYYKEGLYLSEDWLSP